jgi:phage-related minor tail protein
MFYTELQQYTGNKKVDLGLDKAVADEKARLLELRRFAEVVAGSLSNAFSSAFSAIANGANVFEALGQAIKGVIVDLIQAALKGLIFRAIMNAIAPGSGGAVSGLGSLLGGFGGFRAGGGPVGAGRSYIVGENGPELFTPGVSGNIIPNGRLGSVSNSFGGMQVQGVLTGRGNDLVAIISAAGRSNGRLI